MSIRRLFFKGIAVMVLSTLGTSAIAQMDERVARDLATSVVRRQLDLKTDKFLHVQRDEALEQLLAEVISKPSSSEFIYRASQEGDEVKGNTVIPHIYMDVDPSYIIAVSSADGNTYRIQGFSDSMAELERMMIAVNVKVWSPLQAVDIAVFYRAVNPQRRSMDPLFSLIDLKQAAERQCMTGSYNDAEEAKFNAWWKRARHLYSDLQFEPEPVAQDNGFIEEWIVLSTAGPGLCGGAPLRARLRIGSDGSIGEISFRPV
jgi:hypothetical protein